MSRDEKSGILSASNDLVFALNGEKVVIPAGSVEPTTTLAEYLRDSTRFKGTKVGCGEGGCGACAVQISTIDPLTRKVVEISCNACLRPLPSIDGWAVTTIEGIGSSTAGYHPIQERLAGYHGTQCGFCSPGMVMTMYSQLKAFEGKGGSNITMEQVEGFFDGNICRCTGYRPILDAMKSFAKDTDVKDNITGNQTTGAYDDSKDPAFPAWLKEHPKQPLRFKSETGVTWYRATNLKDVWTILDSVDKNSVKYIVANTSIGIYKTESYKTYIDIQRVPELLLTTVGDEGVTVGGSVSISHLISALRAAKAEHKADQTASFDGLIAHALRVANHHVRHVGSVAGNLIMTKDHGFLSDLATILLGANAKVTLVKEGGKRSLSLQEFFSTTLAAGELISSVTIPWTKSGDVYRTYKSSIRSQNSHAYANAAFLFNVDEKKKINEAVLAFGGIGLYDAKGTVPIRAPKTEAFLKGKTLNNTTLQEALPHLKSDVVCQGENKEYRQRLVLGFFFKFFLTALKDGLKNHESATLRNNSFINRGVSKGFQAFTLDEKDKDSKTYKPIPKLEGKIQCSGEARYVADIPIEQGTLHAVFLHSKVGRAKLVSIDDTKASKLPGFVRVFTAKDIPGLNQWPILNIFPLPPAPILAVDTVDFHGQPLGVVVADTHKHALAIAEAVEVKYADVEPPVLNITQAKERKSTFFGAPISMEAKKGDVKEALEKATHKLEGEVAIGSQKHFYMEPSAVYCVPDEDGVLKIHCATQFTTQGSANVCAALKLNSNQVRIISRRCGGSFGGKVTHALLYIPATALASHLLKKPVRLQLSRNTDMRIVGGRDETEHKYEVAYDDQGKILAYNTTYDGDAGWTVDFSGMLGWIVNRGATETYNIPNYKAVSSVWKTNKPSHTAVRGPGEITCSYPIETIIAQVAHKLGITPEEVRERNFFSPDEKEPKNGGGELLDNYTVPQLWNRVKERVKWSDRLKATNDFNKESKWKKRGVAMTTVAYGVRSNPKDAQVNIYADGSVLIHHAGCEMGQGLNTKALQVAASTLGSVLGGPIDLAKIRFADNQTGVLPNDNSGTGGSTGSESVTAAVEKACLSLVDRLKNVLETIVKETEEKAKKEALDAKEGKEPTPPEGKSAFKVTWENLCNKADSLKVLLTSQARWGLDGGAIAYWNYGACFSEVEVDVLSGEVNIIKSDLVYDCGKSLNPAIDIGQVEGAYVYGLGHMLCEREVFGEDGRLVSDGTWIYKPPGVKGIPQEFNVELLQNDQFTRGYLSSKSSGEPPLVLSVSAAMAVRQAVTAYRVEAGNKEWFRLDLPLTPDVIQEACAVSEKQLAL